MFVEIKEIQPQSENRFYHQANSVNRPAFIPQIHQQSKRPQRFNGFHGIEHILQRNSSDTQKIDEIIGKLNKTGNLSRVNVFDTEKNTVTVRKRITPRPKDQLNDSVNGDASEHQKDSKELKVQFVLDCDLKDMDKSTSLRRPLPTSQYILSTVKKLPVQYPNYQSVFNRVPTKAPAKYSYSQPSIVYFLSTTKKTIKSTTPKPRVKNVYVDPPVVAEIADTFETVYSYFENALTTPVKSKIRNQKTATKTEKKRAVKRSTKGNYITYPTTTPNYRQTESYMTQNGQKLTTNIHVTSEYVGKDPADENKPDKGSDSSGDSYDDEYDDDEDDDDDEDEDDDEREDEEYDDDYEYSLTGVSAKDSFFTMEECKFK